MDAETRGRIEETVLEILGGADMESITEAKVRSLAAERLGLDLSLPDRKRFVRSVVESFLSNQAEPAAEAPHEDEQKPAAEEEEEEDDDDNAKRKRAAEKEYDDEGDLIICRLSNKRRVTIQDFRGKTLVSIREYYDKDGKQLPTSKGISLTTEQWAAFNSAVPAIEDAIKKLESDLD